MQVMQDADRTPRTRHHAGVRIEVMPDLDVLIARKPQWWTLWRGIADATPFQSPAWLLCWARHYAPDRTGAIAAWRGDRLLALLPYFSWDGAVWLAGTGPGDYGDALIAPGAAHVAPALLQALAGVAGQRHCERIDLRQLRPDSALLAAATPAGWRSATSNDEPCTSVQLHGRDGLDAISPRWLRNIMLAQRKLEKAGTCTLAPVPAAQAKAGARLLLWLHEKRWRARGETGLFAGDGLLRSFVRAVIPDLQRSGLLRLQRLMCDRWPLAETFAMHAPGGTYFYLTGFDPAWSRFSPGLLTIAASMRAAAAEGDRAAHFLRGDERYKYHLGATACAMWRRVLRKAQG